MSGVNADSWISLACEMKEGTVAVFLIKYKNLMLLHSEYLHLGENT